MLAQRQNSPLHPSQSNSGSKLIDPQKIKTIVSKKLSNKVPNPEQMLQQLQDKISQKIQKTEQQIEKEKYRQDKMKLIQQRQLRARELLNQKIQYKLNKSEKKKATQDKQFVDKRIKARKLKEEYIDSKKQQIQQEDFKRRFQKFKQIKAQNNPKQELSEQKQSHKIQGLQSRKTFSQRSSLINPVQKSKQLQELQYFKKVELVQKRKVYEKAQPKINTPHIQDKSELIQRIKSQSQTKFIQKLGEGLSKIQQARKKREKQINSKIEKMKKSADFKEQQRGYKIQILKQEINQIQKTRRQVLSKKNERFLTARNKSTSQLQRNWSSVSENRDTFGVSLNGKPFGGVSKLSQTLQNFKRSQSIERAKAQDYMVKEKQKSTKRQAINVIQKVLRQSKTQLLMK